MGWKSDFDLGDSAYLNGANHGPLPRVAIDAVQEALSWKRDPSRIDDSIYFTLPDRVRRAAAPFFGCRPQDLAVCTGASSGVGLLAGGIDWRPGDRVVIPDGEFPSNYLPWRALQARGVSVDVVATAGGLKPQDVADALTPTTRVVAVSQVNFATGYRADVEAIGRLCRDRGVAYLIDASQSACTVPLNVQACHATVVVAAGYKWMLSPYGTGLFFVDPEWVDRLPLLAVNWTTVAGAEDFNNLTALALDFRPGAVRWDAPETASFLNLMPMAAALELLGGIGVEGIRTHATALIDRLVAGLPEHFRAGSSARPDERSSIFRIVAEDPEQTRSAYRRCLAAGVSVSMREGGLRVSPGIWNEPEDIDRLLAALD
jgi:selenocysteine lyase/cysteine desulfurase